VKLQAFPNMQLPKYDFGKFNPDDYDLRDKYTMCIKILGAMQEKLNCSLEEIGRVRDKAKSEIDCQYENWEKNLREGYRNQSKKLDILKGELENSKGRIRLVVQELEKTNLGEASSVIKMLELQTEFIQKTMKTVDLKFDTFLSHVQKSSADLCGRISDALPHVGLTCWYDMNASKLDMQGIIQGVLNSKVFTVVLTKNYFERQWCLFEYSIAILADKPMVGIYETDRRFEGGDLNEFNIPKQFKQFMNHEIIKIDRRRWRTFFSSFEEAINARRNIPSVFTDGTEGIKRKSNTLTKNSDIMFLMSRLKSSGLKFGGKLFSSMADGENVKVFHDKCDGKGATLTVVKRKNGIICGGFSPLSWESLDKIKFLDAPDAWLFELADQNTPKVLDQSLGKVQVVLKATLATRIEIKLSSSGNTTALGLHANVKNNGHCIMGSFAGSNSTGWIGMKIEEYEVFQIVKTDMYGSV